IGYQYRMLAYTGDEAIGGTVTAAEPANPGGIARATEIEDPIMSDARNSGSHYGYLGVEHSFGPEFTGSLRAGARYTDYPNAPSQNSHVSPYAQGSLHYIYAPESSVDAGFSFDLSSTDLVGLQNGATIENLTQDAQTFTLYGSLYHRILPRLFGSLVA